MLSAAVLGVSVTALEGLCISGRDLLGLYFADPLQQPDQQLVFKQPWSTVGIFFSPRYCSFPRVQGLSSGDLAYRE